MDYVQVTFQLLNLHNKYAQETTVSLESLNLRGVSFSHHSIMTSPFAGKFYNSLGNIFC